MNVLPILTTVTILMAYVQILLDHIRVHVTPDMNYKLRGLHAQVNIIIISTCTLTSMIYNIGTTGNVSLDAIKTTSVHLTYKW